MIAIDEIVYHVGLRISIDKNSATLVSRDLIKSNPCSRNTCHRYAVASVAYDRVWGRLGGRRQAKANAGIGVFCDVDASSRNILDEIICHTRITAFIDVNPEHEINEAFASIVQAKAGAILVGAGPIFLGKRREIIALATRYKLPASYVTRQYPEAGGLMSYGPSQTDAYRRAGIYVGRILNGAKPADLPVELPTKFELVINIKTAKALGINVPALTGLH